jgi:lipopolysaccharide/colanic/teichoic acid biosynthesis glycosyltransferase
MIKRSIDIAFSIVMLILLFPIIALICFIILLRMPGPILFEQQRIGKEGRPFRLKKFRSMRVIKDAEDGRFDVGNNYRILPFGKTLRKTKLDEIPQLINVLKGEMSIVGPRPEVKQWTEVFPEQWKIVHSIKPGMTDNASVEFRNEEEILAKSKDPIKTYREEILPRKLDLYVEYVNNQSFYGDLKIILKTIKVVIKG